MSENPRPPRVPPPTDPDGSVHGHADEIERSRSRTSMSDRPGSANNPLPPVGAWSGAYPYLLLVLEELYSYTL